MHKADVEALSRMYLLSGVDRAHISALVEAGTIRCFAAGERIFTLGEPADTALLVISGQLEVTLPEGDGQRRLGDVRPGEITGETALLTVAGRRAASVCAERDSRCLELNEALLLDAASSPALIALELHLMGTLVRRIRSLDRSLKQLLTEEAPSAPAEAPIGLLARLSAMLRARA